MDTRPIPSKEMDSIQLDENLDHLAFIKSKLVEGFKRKLSQFLKNNVDIFSWGPEDMQGIDPRIIMHKLSVDSSYKPIK